MEHEDSDRRTGAAPDGKSGRQDVRLTGLLQAWQQGDRSARDRLFPLVYQDLLMRARRQLRRERPEHTLRPSDIVHEAYLRLEQLERIDWKSRVQFFAIAASIMRRVLVDHARERASAKRGGQWRRTFVTASQLRDPEPGVDLLDLNNALDRLGQRDPRKAQLVELRYFGGLSIEEAAQTLGISLATAKRDWQFSRAWLFRQLNEA